MDAVLLPCVFKRDAVAVAWQIAETAARVLKVPLVHEGNYDKYRGKKFSTLYIANYSFLFSGHHDVIAEFVSKADRIVWMSNDYTCDHPRTNNPRPKSILRRAFGDRTDTIPWWSNRPDLAEKTDGHYVNWNIVAYRPMAQLPSKRINRCLYYGSHRKDRADSFQKYFKGVPEGVFTLATHVRNAKKFHEYSTNIEIIPSLKPLYPGLAQYAASLYIEDNDTHTNFHSLATRFYEAVSCKTAILVDAGCRATFERAGVTLKSRWVVRDHNDVRKALRHAADIAEEQEDSWVNDYVAELEDMIYEAKSKLDAGGLL